MNTIRNAGKATLFLGALLSAGLVHAQTPAANQSPSVSAPQTAQQQGHRNFDPNRQAVRLSKRLGLSDDQVAQIKPILAYRFQQMQTPPRGHFDQRAGSPRQGPGPDAGFKHEDRGGPERHAEAAIREDTG